MRISEQIDALEVMGINSASFLVLPKIIAGLTMFPVLVILAGFLNLMGGYLAGVWSGLLTPYEYIYGVRTQFDVYNIWFALTKSITFGFIITSVSSFYGFYVKGGSLEVGQASTEAVTRSCILLLLADFVIAQLFV
jgi:phospholipid/cholesterol/gamma-HCH transport system permease protein